MARLGGRVLWTFSPSRVCVELGCLGLAVAAVSQAGHRARGRGGAQPALAERAACCGVRLAPHSTFLWTLNCLRRASTEI